MLIASCEFQKNLAGAVHKAVHAPYFDHQTKDGLDALT
jgi:hypothetical protein